MNQPHNSNGGWLPGISGLGVAGIVLDAAHTEINSQVARFVELGD